MADKFKLDLGKLAQGVSNGESSNEAEHNLTVTTTGGREVAFRNPEIAWMVATRGLQANLIHSLQDYRTTWRDKKAIAVERQRLIEEVTVQYVDYLREEAKLASAAALKARDAILRQELTKLRANLFTQLADITGRAVVDIESIFQDHAAKINSPALQEAYAKFIMTKILDLLEQSQ
jgi:hypothetical protein